ncbi:MAG: hypothetical protein FJ303_16215 [Planctomycetes bacterium]|nr:hypothetical protein [Planctomycetota bacterium]
MIQAGHVVQISGRLTDDVNLSDYSISGTGAPALLNADSNGNYTYSTTNATLGQLFTQGTNSQNVSTNTSNFFLSKQPPTLTLSVSYGTGASVTLSGTLDDIDKSGRIVTFSGVATGMTTTNATGHFSWTTTPTGVGEIHANGTDLWGQAANTATVTVTSNVPTIVNFEAVHGSGNTWIFRGRVIDDQPEGLTVRFGGLMSLVGVTATTDADGYFSITHDITAGETSGTASAIVTDWWGQDSETVYDALT